MKKLNSFLFILLLSFGILADDHSPQLISDTWTMVPKAGHEAKFEEAFKKHIAYRKANGDTREWVTWRPVTGDQINSYLVRACCNPC